MPIEWLLHRIMYQIKEDIRPDFIIVSLSKSSRLLFLLLFSHGSFVLWNSSATIMHSHELIQIISSTVTTIALLFKGTVHPIIPNLYDFLSLLEHERTTYLSTFLLQKCIYPCNSLATFFLSFSFFPIMITEEDYNLLKVYFCAVPCTILCNEFKKFSHNVWFIN